jgi:sugar O-acyltransferase (sialic acid O-acetyltransferase NeuD family)
MSNHLIFVGAGGHAKDIMSIVEAQNQKFRYWAAHCFISDDPNYYNNKYQISGTVDDLPTIEASIMEGRLMFAGDLWAVCYVVAINDSHIRKTITHRIRENMPTLRGVTLVHPTACLSRDINESQFVDVVIGPNVTMTGGVRIGAGTHINSCVSINQSSIIGDFVTIGPGARICGDVTIEDEVQIGAGAIIINTKTVGAGAIVGAGAVVIDNIPPGETVAGVPARSIH